MNVDKAELKIAVATDIGASIEDTFEAAKKDMYRQEGAINAYSQAAKACELLCEHVNKDLEEGKIESLETADLVKHWLTRAANAQRTLVRNAENLGMAASGRVAGLEQTVELVRKYRDAEKLKIAAAKLVSPQDPAVVDLSRPGLSIKERRLLEEKQVEMISAAPEKVLSTEAFAATIPAASANGTRYHVSELPSHTANTVVPPKRRGRPPKKRD